jgi:glycerol-3-phosphate dehydrogenase (NAD(P)+)
MSGLPVRLWARRPELARDIGISRQNVHYLPGIHLPEQLLATADLGIALECRSHVIVAVPSQHLRVVGRMALSCMAPGTLVLTASKGIEVPTLMRMSEVLSEELGGLVAGVAAISGPNFAEEVARQVPTATVVASPDLEVARTFQRALMAPHFRVYTNTDIIGVEIGGALKNIYAIGAGLIDGMGLGHNTRAAFMTRALSELVRLGLALGARSSTFSGLSGMGDLVLTATGNLSRNRQCGMELGKGRRLRDILENSRMVVEGVETTRAASSLARRHGVEMPIVEGVYAILFQDADPASVLQDLMTRDPKAEMEDLPAEH